MSTKSRALIDRQQISSDMSLYKKICHLLTQVYIILTSRGVHRSGWFGFLSKKNQTNYVGLLSL